MIRQKVIDNYRDMVASLKTELKLAEAEVERLQKALEVVCADLACDDACPDHEGADWPECQNCPGRHGEIHQDTERDIRCRAYEKYEIEERVQHICPNCEAYQFHDYLQKQGFEIIHKTEYLNSGAVVDAAREFKLRHGKVATCIEKGNLGSMRHYSLLDDLVRAETLLLEALAELDKEVSAE